MAVRPLLAQHVPDIAIADRSASTAKVANRQRRRTPGLEAEAPMERIAPGRLAAITGATRVG